MKLKGPIVTLAAGLLVAGVLMVMNLRVTSDNDLAAGDSAAATTPAAATAAPAGAKTTPSVQEKATYAGDVDGATATIAIAIKDGQAVAYLCDGRKTEAWLRGTASNGELLLRGSGDARLDGSYANSARGTVVVGGRTWTFSVKQVQPPSGLYRATANVRGALVDGGWIIEPDGEQTGVLTVNGEPQPAPSLDTASNTVTVAGTDIAVKPVDGSES